MWIYTKHGAYSVVKHSEGMQVRARHKQYLEDLLEATETEHHIIDTPRRDYGYRIIVDLEKWETISQYLMSSIDYPDFKSHLHSKGFFNNGVEENYAIYTGAYNSYVKNSDSLYAY